MLLTVKNTKGKKVQIFDVRGREIKAVYSFDTETCELSFYLTAKHGDKVRVLSELDSRGKHRAKKIVTKMRGAYAVIDGVKIKTDSDYCGAV